MCENKSEFPIQCRPSLCKKPQNMSVRSHQVKTVMYMSVMFCKCSPSAEDAKLACESVLAVTGGESDTWKPKSGLQWQELCTLAFGEHHPKPLGTMANTADVAYSTMKTLNQYGVLPDNCLALMSDVSVLKRLVSICMAYDSDLQFVVQCENSE